MRGERSQKETPARAHNNSSMMKLTGRYRVRVRHERRPATLPLVFALICCAAVFSAGCQSDDNRPQAAAPIAAGSLSGQNVLSVSYIDIGQGDSQLIQTPSGKNILIDTGAAEGRKALLGYLEQRGVRQLDLVIATHPHLDHVGNLPQVIDAYPVGEFLDSGLVTGSPAQERYLRALKEKRVKFTIVSRRGADTTRDLGDGITLTLLQPRAPLLSDTDSDPNNNSIVALLTSGKVRFLFTGDMEEDEREQRLYPSGDSIRAEIYKVAHHGSRNGTDDAFMERVQPQEAIISCGVRNDYGHPHPETLAALEK